MADIFISHSSRDLALVRRLVDLLETGVGVPGRQIFASSVAGKGVPHGDFRAYIHDEITRATLAIFVFSPNFENSAFCMTEMGAAWALGKTVLLYVTPG